MEGWSAHFNPTSIFPQGKNMEPRVISWFCKPDQLLLNISHAKPIPKKRPTPRTALRALPACYKFKPMPNVKLINKFQKENRYGNRWKIINPKVEKVRKFDSSKTHQQWVATSILKFDFLVATNFRNIRGWIKDYFLPPPSRKAETRGVLSF